MVAIEIPGCYGTVVLAAVAPFLLNFWQMRSIGKLRKKHGIEYPTMYSDKYEDFNCAQRAHQNTLELIPFYFALLLCGGIRHPCLASLAGLIFIYGRVSYSLGYYTGKPEKRIPGAKVTFLGGLFPLFVLSISTAAKFLEWW